MTTHLKFITKIKRAQNMTMMMKQRLSENFGSLMACTTCPPQRFECLLLHYYRTRYNFPTWCADKLSYNINN